MNKILLVGAFFVLFNIITGCTTDGMFCHPHKLQAPYANTNNAISLIVFVEDPIQTIKPARQYSPEETYYDWVLDAFSTYAGKKVNLFSDKFISDVADQYQVEHTIANAPIPYSSGKTQIHHLAFAEDKMSWLCDFGAKAGATHIIKLCYVSRNVTFQHIRKESHENFYNILEYNSMTEGDADVIKMIVSYRIYDTQKGQLIDSGIFDSSNDSEAKDTSFYYGKQDRTIKRRLVETVMAQICSKRY